MLAALFARLSARARTDEKNVRVIAGDYVSRPAA
jgi:hypothetical protein